VTKLKVRAITAGAAGVLAALGLALTTSSAQAATGASAQAAVGPASSSANAADNTVAAATATGSYSIAKVGAATPAASPDTCGPSNYGAELLGSRYDVWLCGVTTYNTTGLGPFNDLWITSANRVWLHQYDNNTGWADCYSNWYWPGGKTEFSLTGSQDANPGNIQQSANTTFCS
jgi:hypothetical protein